MPLSLFFQATNSTCRKIDKRRIVPEKKSFIAWSDGVRNCPGKSFAQVESVATTATLFRSQRFEVFPISSESAEKRVHDVVKKNQMELLLEVRNPERVQIR